MSARDEYLRLSSEGQQIFDRMCNEIDSLRSEVANLRTALDATNAYVGWKREREPIKNEHREGKRYPYLQVLALTFDDLTAVLVRDGIIDG